MHPEGSPLLRYVWPLGLLGLLATLAGRMLAPSLVGVAVGIGKLVRTVDRVGATLTQLFAVASIAAAAALVPTVAQSRSGVGVRIGAVVSGALAALVVMSAGRDRVPNLFAALVGVSAGVLAIGAAWDARRAPFARPAALVISLVGAGALLRVVAAFLADRAAGGASLALSSAARGLATAAFSFDGLAALAATAALAQRRAGSPSGQAGGAPPERMLSPLILVALGVAFVAARQASAASVEEARAVELLLRRMLERLVAPPLPAVSTFVQLFVAALSLVTAALVLAARRVTPAIAGAVALSLLARGAADSPLGGMSLVVAALGLSLASRDDRGLWAALLGGKADAQGASGEPR